MEFKKRKIKLDKEAATQENANNVATSSDVASASGTVSPETTKSNPVSNSGTDSINPDDQERELAELMEIIKKREAEEEGIHEEDETESLDPKAARKAKKAEAARKKEEAKRQKREAKKQKKAEKKEKKRAKKAGKITVRHVLADSITDAAADVIIAHDTVQAKFDNMVGAAVYSIVYEFNDMRNRYRQSGGAMMSTFFSTIVVICLMLIAFNRETVYQYSYNGRVLGYVEDQESVYNILDVAGEKLSSANDAKITFKAGQNVTFKLVSSSEKDIDTADQALNKLTYMTDIDVTAYGIFEDGVLKAVVDSKSKADTVLDDVLDYYRTPDNGMKVTQIKFKNSVEVREVNVMLTSVMSTSEAEKMLEEGGDLSIQHIVMENETETSMAETYGVSSDNIHVQADENGEVHSLAESGDKVQISTTSKPIVVQMKEHGTMSEVIKYKTVKKKTKKMYRGDSEVIQKGVNGRQTITGTLVYENGKEVSRDISSKEVLKKSVDKIMLVGTNDKPKWYPTGTYIIPVKNEVITSYFGSRWGRIHGGLDFGMPIGTPIYASDGGTVTRASYFSGYGLCIEVTHNNGTFTRYGHCSKVVVKVGDKVAQGEKIGEVGNTGNSTGPHLHFEIHPNGGEYVDPYPYIYGSNKGNSVNNE